MRIPLAIAAAAALAACVGMQPAAGPETYTMCLDNSGVMRAAVCTGGGPGRLSTDPGYCVCGDHSRPVAVPVCLTGQSPPSPTREYELARLSLSRDGTLVGDSYMGQPICMTERTDR